MALRKQTQQHTATTRLGLVISCTQLWIILQSSLFQLVSHKIHIQKPLFFSTIFSFFQKKERKCKLNLQINATLCLLLKRKTQQSENSCCFHSNYSSAPLVTLTIPLPNALETPEKKRGGGVKLQSWKEEKHFLVFMNQNSPHIKYRLSK